MTKLIWDINRVENRFKIKLKRKCTVIGLDTASRTGWCIAKTNGRKLELNIGMIDIDVSKIKDKNERNQIRYNEFYEKLSSLITNQDIVLIEDVFYSINPATLILLARIGAIAFTVAKQKKIKTIKWLSAVQARKALGLPSNKKKEIVQQEFKKKLNLKIEQNDEIDAVILSLNALAE